ncbi:Maf family protein [Rhodococcus chondri]|uniref:Nucleoside triphosphate pyrophosphatase n=1 Tax=Rhodococcus chondri TaxID=3065941 RepID=A0ABU7JQZ3_9NOCA|nr:nucleoside triphosphate pyrophosphatase [Rhodococcus sp. CC-R104]MEE2032456.1 nucleoside triphosphate pyrophosphatase [Rhodococcus sp. CC-R104]
MPRLVLASASPARLSVLHTAGVKPVVRVSGVDEDAVVASLDPGSTPAQIVTELARAKATEVVPELRDEGLQDALVIGCDSMLLIDGQLQGKPGTVDQARARWRAMAGNSAELLTGHCVVRVRDNKVIGQACDHSATTVFFGTPTDEELESYLESGEPLEVAGAFTLDGLGGWFIDRIEGDPSSVIGIGLPLVRRLLAEVGVSVAQLWAENAAIPLESLEN